MRAVLSPSRALGLVKAGRAILPSGVCGKQIPEAAGRQDGPLVFCLGAWALHGLHGQCHCCPPTHAAGCRREGTHFPHHSKCCSLQLRAQSYKKEAKPFLKYYNSSNIPRCEKMGFYLYIKYVTTSYGIYSEKKRVMGKYCLAKRRWKESSCNIKP